MFAKASGSAHRLVAGLSCLFVAASVSLAPAPVLAAPAAPGAIALPDSAIETIASRRRAPARHVRRGGGGRDAAILGAALLGVVGAAIAAGRDEDRYERRYGGRYYQPYEPEEGYPVYSAPAEPYPGPVYAAPVYGGPVYGGPVYGGPGYRGDRGGWRRNRAREEFYNRGAQPAPVPRQPRFAPGAYGGPGPGFGGPRFAPGQHGGFRGGPGPGHRPFRADRPMRHPAFR